MKEIILGGILLIQGIFDLKDKQIPLVVCAIGAGMGIGICIYEERGILSLLQAILPGVFALLFARFSKETMGYGDGLMLVIMGMYLSWEALLTVGMLAFGIAGIVALLLLVVFHKKGSFQIPFVPFLTVSYILYIFINGGVSI